MKKKKVFQKLATVLTVSMLMTSVTPLAGLAETYYEAPISEDFVEEYDLDEIPKVYIKVQASNPLFEITTDDLKENNEFRTEFSISVTFDDIASPGNASPSDWDPDFWAQKILSELEFEPIFSEDTIATAERVGAEIILEKSPYALTIKVNEPEKFVPEEGSYLTAYFNTVISSITYPGERAVSVPGITVIISDSPGGDDYGDYIPVEHPVWFEGYPGWGTWDNNILSDKEKELVKYTTVRVFRDGECVCPEDMVSSRGYQKAFDMREFFTESGEYTFQANFNMINRWYIPEEFWFEESVPIDFTLPDQAVSVPRNLKWLSDGTVTWDDVPDKELIGDQKVARYYVNLYEKDDETGEYEMLGTFYKIKENQMDVSADLEADRTYKFRVMAMGDLTEYANSEFSDFSEEFMLNPVAQKGAELIDNLLNSDNVKENVENTKLSEDVKGNLKLAVQAYGNVAEKYAELEEAYMLETGQTDFPIETGESGLDAGEITVVGGALNGAAGIKFAKPTTSEMNDANVSQYRSKYAFNIELEGALEGDLNYPVLITMPVPSGFDAEDIVIIHIRHGENKTPERIRPRVNGDGTVSFAVTEFSTFFFVDSSSTGGSGSSGGGGGGGSSFSGTSAAGTVTTDAKKGRVNSLTGIIIGSGDGYSKWISETPQGQPEAATRWKLQYADGTFAAGSYVTDAQGNFVKDAAGNPIEQPLWELISGAWYAFGADGYAKSGFLFDPALNGTFYLDINTGMKTGWQQIDGKWYYFNQSSDGAKGIMYVSRTTPDGYAVNEAGVWDGTTSQTN